ncbi:hypothetical protein AMJ80_05110 [bacterium SM23_31]|nr:MAG: hypothetical protein AMJ80_05110 [bacterium SM23_31]
MRILLLYYSPWWNATAYYGVTLAQGLQRAGHTVWFGTDETANAGHKAREKGIPIFNVKLQTINPVKAGVEISRLARFIKRENIDIVNTFSPQGHLFYFLAKRMFGLKAPLIRTCCDARKPKGNPFNKYLYNRCVNWLIFPCRSNLERYYNVLKFPPKNSSIIYGAIDINRYDHDKPHHILQKKYGLAKDTPVVGIIARLSPEKGHNHFLHVAAKVSSKINNAAFVIVGRQEQITIDSLKKLANNLGIADRVIFTGYIADPRSVVEEFAVGVIASRFSETISRAALEFMASAKPVVAANVNVLGEIIRHEKTGMVYDVDDVDGMADGIVELLSNQEKCAELGNNGRRDILEKFTIEKCAEETIAVYKNVLKKPGADE